MADIKIKEKKKGTVKTLNKAIVNTEKVKDKSMQMKNKVSEAYEETNENGTNYAINRISRQTKRTPDDIRRLNRIGKRNFKKTVENTQKTVDRIRKIKSRNKTRKSIKQVRKTAKATKKTVKTADRTIKTTKKAAKTTAKATKKTVQATKAAVKATIKTIKVVIKITITAIKTIIAALKSLIALIIAGGWISVIIIVVVCLVALIAHSIFGIFLSSQDTGSKITINGEQQVVTMDRVISNLNTEFINKMTQIQKDNKHDEYDINSKRAEWKDILAVYTVKISNGKNDAEVMTLDNNKISILKEIFWEMNEITSSTEEVTDKDNKKKIVLHINVNGKDALEMAQKYNFSIEQNKQLAELTDNKYASLWNGVIYGATDSGEYVNWRQAGQSWSNIKIGNTNSTIGNIGCLVTSIAILIEKSGVPTPNIEPFNPGTFVEALNKNGGFDERGNLYYGPISKVVPNFKYVGNVNLRGKSRSEKLALITQYVNAGYFVTEEVKGATPGNQHWVAVTGVNGNNVIMVDPASNQTDMWSAYEWSKSSQFNYFKAE